MSKISQLHAILTQQAAELGFRSIEEAEANGYGVDYENAKLIEPEEAAHKAWLKEKEKLLALLENAIEHNDECYESEFIDYALREAIEFVKGVSHE